MPEPAFTLDTLLESLAERVASKLRAAPATEGISPRLLTVEQAATYLGRSKDAVDHMVSSAKLPTVRIDRRVFIDLHDLHQLIEDSKVTGLR
jgi:excisionase family DNA binding protein